MGYLNMIISIDFTSVAYSVSKDVEDDRQKARRSIEVCHIYEENVTTERIVKEIPQGAIIEDACNISAKFEVDGDKLLGWLLEHGELK